MQRCIGPVLNRRSWRLVKVHYLFWKGCTDDETYEAKYT
jgi:hypothetical protein